MLNEEEELTPVFGTEESCITPEFKLRSFIKFVYEDNDFRDKLIKFLTNASSDLDIDDLKVAGEFMAYSRGWYWISQFDLEDPKWVESSKYLDQEKFNISLNNSLSYFQKHEEYEKCAFIKKIQDLLGF
jgi:hypothetical protein